MKTRNPYIYIWIIYFFYIYINNYIYIFKLLSFIVELSCMETREGLFLQLPTLTSVNVILLFINVIVFPFFLYLK